MNEEFHVQFNVTLKEENPRILRFIENLCFFSFEVTLINIIIQIFTMQTIYLANYLSFTNN